MRNRTRFFSIRQSENSKVNEPLQVSVTGQKELMLRFYSPRAIHNVIVWATVEGYEDEVRFAELLRFYLFRSLK